jgi:hypothetical protein
MTCNIPALLAMVALALFGFVQISRAAWYADPAALSVSTAIDPDALCDGFHEQLLAQTGVGTGTCDYPNNGAQFWTAADPRDGTWEDASTYMPPGTAVASYFVGQLPMRRFSNAPTGFRFHTWEHSTPNILPTCPLTPDESICLEGQCEPQWALNYLSEVYPNPQEWSFRSMDTRVEGEDNGDRYWGGSLSFTFPAAPHVVATLAIRKEHSKDVGPGTDWLFNSQYAYFYGINRHVTVEAYSCAGVPSGGGAVVVDAVDLYTGPSGQLWSAGCALGDPANRGASVLCDIGLGDGVATISGVHVTSIDGAAVDVNHLRAGVYSGEQVMIPAPPLPEEIPSGEAAEFDPEMSPDPGCLEDPALLAEIATWSEAAAGYCYYDTVHILDGVTHHGDCDGWRHPSYPAEVDCTGLSARASGDWGHLYPEVFYNNVVIPEPHPVQLIICGVALIAMLHALRRS